MDMPVYTLNTVISIPMESKMSKCPKCGTTEVVAHQKYGHLTYACGYSTGYSMKGTPCSKNIELHSGTGTSCTATSCNSVLLVDANKLLSERITALLVEAKATKEKHERELLAARTAYKNWIALETQLVKDLTGTKEMAKDLAVENEKLLQSVITLNAQLKDSKADNERLRRAAKETPAKHGLMAWLFGDAA